MGFFPLPTPRYVPHHVEETRKFQSRIILSSLFAIASCSSIVRLAKMVPHLYDFRSGGEAIVLLQCTSYLPFAGHSSPQDLGLLHKGFSVKITFPRGPRHISSACFRGERPYASLSCPCVPITSIVKLLASLATFGPVRLRIQQVMPTTVWLGEDDLRADIARLVPQLPAAFW